ncbi:alpha/beta fold hydrolase [Thermus aquaticus]|jgi:proline iminopeptidase|uniref:Proline iminopeptidase n=1 Tax=Thermus aquaticus (strain ATCC BAA-2747 / Y51MC23) TaxID=498848 RepID=A0ABN4IF96_THEA5|nr:alpha/beta hydrolase [Thermus aquaticus]ALJ90190.1 proline iminopeptidase [Thermus aquaticus Y51MC23]
MREEIGYIPVGEAELYVEDVGDPHAPALLVLHGGPGGNAYALREGLGEYLEGFRAIYFDQRGSGRSLELPEDPRLFTIDALVEDTLLLAEALGLERFALLGHGFGALVALEVLRRYPGVEGAILLGPWVSFPWLAQRLAEAAGLTPEEDPEANLRAALERAEPKALFDRLMFPSPRGRLEYEWVVEGSGVVGPDTPARAFLRNGLWRLDYTPYLTPSRRPVAIVVGEKDGTSYPYAEEVAERLKAPIHVVPEAGHFPWIDQPEAFGQAFLEALAALRVLH